MTLLWEGLVGGKREEAKGCGSIGQLNRRFSVGVTNNQGRGCIIYNPQGLVDSPHGNINHYLTRSRSKSCLTGLLQSLRDGRDCSLSFAVVL